MFMKPKIIKIILSLMVFVFVSFYGYYNYHSFIIYNEIEVYEQLGNEMAVNLSKQIIVEKYPYSIPYFIIR